MVGAREAYCSGCAQRHASRAGAGASGGFTLVELLTTLSILTVLVTLAAPSFAELMASQRVQTAASDLFTSLLRARSEAIKRNSDATLSPAGTWTGGWVVEAAGETIDAHGATTSIAIAPNVANVTYRSSGQLSGATIPKFAFSSPRTATKRCVQIDLRGRPVVINSECPA